MSYLIFVLALLISSSLSKPPPRVSKVYRTDYEYNKQTDAFYKLHIESRQGWQLDKLCETEGAKLMVPASQQDIAQVHGMLKRFPDLGQYVFVASDNLEHESAEETAIITFLTTEEPQFRLAWHRTCDVMSRNGDIETMACYRQLPFICKVEAKDAPYDPQCDLFANNYKYNTTIGSCYKIPYRVASWNEAYAECRAEGAHLVVLNSETERAVVQSLMNETPKIEGAKTSWFFFAGFRANKPVGNETVVFKTIFNQTLEEAGFAEWSPNEPNNALGNEYCGTLFSNDGKLNDVDCSHEYAFICEKEVHM